MSLENYSRIDWSNEPLNEKNMNQLQDMSFNLSTDIDTLGKRTDELYIQYAEILNRLNRTVSLVHNCANCGGQLYLEENKQVVHCKYCGSAYIVGAAQIYSNY